MRTRTATNGTTKIGANAWILTFVARLTAVSAAAVSLASASRVVKPWRSFTAVVVNRLNGKIGWLGVLALMLLGQGEAGAQVIRLISSPGKFYVDDKSASGIVFNYAAYMVSNNTPSNLSSVYVAMTNIVATNLIQLAPTDTGVRQLGGLAPGESKMAAFYLQGPGFTKGADSLSGLTNENHTIQVLNGPPGVGLVLASATYGFTNIEFVIEASANKVTIITNLNPLAVLGSEVALVIAGDTGTIGGQNSLSLSPGVLGSWRPDAYQLLRNTITFTQNPTYTNQLYFDPSTPGFTNFSGQSYTNTMIFRAIKVTGTNVAISPFAFIDSGAGTKHTALTSLSSANGSNIIVSATNFVSIVGHTVTPSSFLAPGGPVTYTITFSNSASININLDEIVDTLPGVPANATYIPGSAVYNSVPLVNPSISGQTLRWALPLTIPSNNISVLTFQATAPVVGGTYTNRVIGIIGGEQIDTTTITTDNNASTSVFTVTPVSDIAVGKTGPSNVIAGTNFNYTISVTNLGPSPSAFLSVTDALPASVSFVSASGGGVFGSGRVVWTNLAGLAANASTSLTVTVTAPGFTSTLANSATGRSTYLDPNPTNNTSPPVFTSVMGTNINPVANNDSATTLAGQSVIIAATANDTDVNGDPLTITLVSPTNGTATIVNGTNVSFTPTPGFDGTATIGYTISDGQGGTASAVITVTVAPLADLVVSKAGPAAVYSGTNFNYFITVSNLGPGSASSLFVSDQLPAGVTFVTASSGGTLNGTQVVWSNLAGLAAGTSTNLTLTVKAPADGASLTNVANVTSPTSDPNPTNNTSLPVFTSVTPVADLGVSKSGPAVSVLPGANFDYTLTVTNSGPSTALAVTLTDNLPASLTFFSATGGGVFSGGNVVWTNIGDLAAGASTSLTLTVTAPLSGSVTNVATVTSPTTDTNLLNNSNPPVTTVVSNLPPVAVNDSATTPKNVSVNVPVLANDSDANGDTLTITLVSPTNGTAMISGTNVAFTPASNFVGTSTIGYTISDGNGGTASALISVTVFNTAPVAAGDSYSTAEDVMLTVPAISGVLANDFDADSDPLTAVLVATTTNGVLALNPNGGFTYTPGTNFNGTDTFAYQASDGLTTSATATVTITITPVNDAPVLALAIPDQAGVYGTNFSYTFPTNTFTEVDAGQTLTFTATNLPPGISFNAGTRTFSGTPTAAGTFTVTVTATDNGAPALGTSDTFDIVVARVPLNVTAANATRGFGQTNPPFTFTLTGFVLGDTTNVVSGAPALSSPATNTSPVGTYPINVALGTLAASNYTFNFIPGTLSVTGAVPVVGWNPAGPIVYGTPLGAPQLNATSSVPGVFTYAPSNGVVLNAGTNLLSAVFTPSDTNNYSPVNVSADLVVLRALLGVTASNQTRVYNATNPALTFSLSGFVNGDVASNAVSGAPVLTTSAVTNSPVGAYPINVAAGSLSASNYTFALTNGTLTVTPGTPVITWTPLGPIIYGTPLGTNQLNATSTVPGTNTYSPTNGVILPVGTNTLTVVSVPGDTNYVTLTNTANLVVLPANLNVTALNAVRGFGQANPPFFFTITGFVLGEGSNVVSGSPSLSTPATPASPVGPYPITVDVSGLSASNYTFTGVPGTLSVTGAVPVVGWNPVGPIVYGTPLGTNQLNATSSVPGVFTYTPSNGAVLNAGTNPLSALFTPSDTNNYAPVNLNASLVVTPALLSVTASNQTRVYNTANPTLTFGISGFVNGDAASNAVSGTPNLSTPATLSSPVGSYPINVAAGTLSASNYTFALTNGQLTVTPASPVITWTPIGPITYGTPYGTNQLNATSSVPGTFFYSPPLGSITNAGTNTLSTVFTPADTNYAPITSTVPFLILKAPLTATANNQSVGVGAPLPPLTISYSGFVNGDGPGVLDTPPVATTTATTNSPAGLYAITPAGGLDNNYTFNYVNGVLTVGVVTPTLQIVRQINGFITFNPQTSLFEQTVRLTNDTTATFTALRIVVSNLTNTVRLYNAHGTNNTGNPYVDVVGTLAPGQAVTVLLEYWSNNRQPFAPPSLSVEVLSYVTPPPPVGTLTAIDRSFMAANGRFYLEWASEAGRTYYVQYADNPMGPWKTVFTPVAGTGFRIVWIDEGPPKTESVGSSGRYYRLIVQ